jgi:hypothetical protein
MRGLFGDVGQYASLGNEDALASSSDSGGFGGVTCGRVTSSIQYQAGISQLSENNESSSLLFHSDRRQSTTFLGPGTARAE